MDEPSGDRPTPGPAIRPVLGSGEDEFALLRDAAPAELERLLDRARRRRFAAGEVVFHAGDPGDTVHLIRSGRFAVRVVSEFADTVTLTVLGPGESFGELTLLSPGAPRSATVAALEEAETLSVHEIEFNRLRRERPQTDALLVELLAAQVKRLSSQLAEAFHLPAELRVRRRLLAACVAYGTVEAGATVPLTQAELAELAGTSRATVSKVLGEERGLGTIEVSRGRTTLLDPEAIARRAGGAFRW